MANSQAPNNLEDQLFFVYLRVFKEVAQAFPFKRNGVTLKINHSEIFKEKFNQLKSSMTTFMKDKKRRSKDSHKLASLACLTVLLIRPLEVEKNGEGHMLNEVMAYLIAVRIIQLYQRYRFCEAKDKHEQLKDKVGFMSTPELIYEKSPVHGNTVVAFAFLSRAIKSKDLDSFDLALLLSTLFFYMDVSSQNVVKEYAKTL